MVSVLPQDVIINNIFSHLYPSDIEKCKEANDDLKKIIEDNEEYIDTICQHIQPHGETKEYNKNGQLLSHKYYKEGKQHGESKEWYENGQLLHQTYFKEGKPHGERKTWYDNGQLLHQKYYKEGKEHGEFKYWYENGQLYYQEYFKEGKQYGEYKVVIYI